MELHLFTVKFHIINLKCFNIYVILKMMKKIGFIIFVLLYMMLVTLLIGVGGLALAENEITIASIVKTNANGEIIPYDSEYSRDVTLNYEFKTAYSYVVKVYKNNGLTYDLIRTSDSRLVKEGKGMYAVLDDGDLRIDCIANNNQGNEIASISQMIKSDITAPTSPTIDTDGAFDKAHSENFSIGYIINYDNLSGVDFSRSTYCIKDLDGNAIVEDSLVASGYNKALINGINQNCKVVFTIYDNAGNFVVAEKRYNLHYYVNSTAPTISISPQTGYSPNVMVTLTWPMGVSYKYYKIIVNGTERARAIYTTPFSIVDEGLVEIRAYYFENDSMTYVSKTINNVDKTPPTDSSIAETVRVKVDLTSDKPVVLSVAPNDGRSGIKRVYLKNFGIDFELGNINIYSVDVTSRLGTNVGFVVEDNAGNVTEYNYPLNGFDKEKIEYYSNAFKQLNPNAYDAVAWEELLNAYNRLSNLLSSQDSSSGDISKYSKAVDSAIEGKNEVRVTLVDVIDGLINDFSATVPVNGTNVKKGGRLNLAVNKLDVSEEVFNEKIQIGATVAKFPSYDSYGFNLALTDNEDQAVTIYNTMYVSLTIPGAGKLAKIFQEKDGVLVQLSTTLENNVLTFQTEQDGDFYLIVETDMPKEQGKGLMIGGKFFPLKVLLIAGGIILGAMLLTGGLTPLIYKLVKDKKRSRNKFDYFR